MATGKPPRGPGGPKPPISTPRPEARSVPKPLAEPLQKPVSVFQPELEPPPRQTPQPTPLETGREGVGDEALSQERFAELSPALVAEHLMILLAKKRKTMDRAQVLEEVGPLVMSLSDPDFVRKALFLMPQVGKIVDVYPLELLAWVLERDPERVSRVRFAPFIQNRAQLEAGLFEVDAPISIRIPLAMRVRDFALEGGGTPGYCFAPGAPAEYVLEMGDEGTFSLMIRGEIRKEGLIDRVQLKVFDPQPGSA